MLAVTELRGVTQLEDSSYSYDSETNYEDDGAGPRMVVARNGVSKAKRTQHALVMRLIDSFLFALILTLAYVVMLVVMTYNASLLLSLILGAWIGHFLFGYDGPEFEAEDPCCSTN
jgi:hypothetical protein